MADYKFSVGKILIDDVELGKLRNITVTHDGAPVELRAGDYRFPLEIHPGDQSLTVTAETTDYDASDPSFATTRQTLKLESGPNGGGIVVTLTNMVLVNKEVTGSQDGYTSTSCEWRKVEAA